MELNPRQLPESPLKCMGAPAELVVDRLRKMVLYRNEATWFSEHLGVAIV